MAHYLGEDGQFPPGLPGPARLLAEHLGAIIASVTTTVSGTCANGDGRNTVSDLVAINVAIFNPALVTPLCDGNNDGKCDVNDIIAANTEIFSPGNTSTCARQPVPGP